MTEDMARDYMTTGELARETGLSIRTIGKLFDDGHLEGYMMPGTNHRRISRASAARLLAEFQADPDSLKLDFELDSIPRTK